MKNKCWCRTTKIIVNKTDTSKTENQHCLQQPKLFLYFRHISFIKMQISAATQDLKKKKVNKEAVYTKKHQNHPC